MEWGEWLDKCPVEYLLMTMNRETITYRFDLPDDDLEDKIKFKLEKADRLLLIISEGEEQNELDEIRIKENIRPKLTCIYTKKGKSFEN
jgi:predicted ATP-grasp superfamily ATP-dependent carboligase